MKRVLFRVDANKRLGIGHMSRCFELAKKLRKFNVTPYFFIKEDNRAINLIKELGFQFFTFSKTSNDKKELSMLINLHRKIKFDCLIVDLKKTKNKNFFIRLEKICKTVVIDNTNKNSLYADLIIWPWVKEQYSKNVILNNSQKILVGPKYMLLGNIKKNWKRRRRQNSILISMGGSDKRGLTIKIIKSFQKTKYKFHADIVLGRFFSDSEKILEAIKNDKRFAVIRNNEGLISVMSSYKVGIFSFGITTFEAFFANLPSLVISHSNENDVYAKKTAVYDCMRYLGKYDMVNFDKLPQITFALMENSELYKKYSSNGQNLVDGKGTERVSKIIVDIIKK